MNKTFKDIREFIAYLENRDDLVRVKQEVDPDLEINAILDTLARTNGPAVLFENVKGSTLPLLGNAFGNYRRLSNAFGTENLDDILADYDAMITQYLDVQNKSIPRNFRARGMKARLRALRDLPRIIKLGLNIKKLVSPITPIEIPRRKAPCKEVVLQGKDIDLDKFPLIKCWPQDGGFYITLPLIITQDPEEGDFNVGIYRMMQIDKTRLCMHWLPQKHGSQHHAKAVARNEDLPVAIAIGADPALEVAGVFQLLPPLDEFMAAGFLKKEPIELVRAENSDLLVPAGAEIVLEGVVKAHEPYVDEGPYGEFHGYYSPVKQTPVFHVQKITHRKNPIWHAATTGMPPTEIHVFSKAAERVGILGFQRLFPGMVDLNMTRESGTLYLAIVSLKKNRRYEAQELMHFMWSAAAQTPYITTIIVVDHDVNVHDYQDVFSAVTRNFRPHLDLTTTPPGLADLERPSTFPRGVGARLGVDATTKWPEEGKTGPRPERAQMDEATRQMVEKNWQAYGF